MTRGVGGHSPANVTTHLKGIHFPADKRTILETARRNKAPPEVMDEIQAMPEQDYASVAEIMKAFGGRQGPERHR